jgi:adenylate kinase family enzyme
MKLKFGINEELMTESLLFKEPDLALNIEDFKKKKSDRIFLTGLSGSGKSTLARQIVKTRKSVHVQMDDVAKKLKAEHGDEMFSDTLDPKFVSDKFIEEVEAIVKKNKGKLVIVDGVQVLKIDFEYLKDYPVYSLNTPLIKSFLMAQKRMAKKGQPTRPIHNFKENLKRDKRMKVFNEKMKKAGAERYTIEKLLDIDEKQYLQMITEMSVAGIAATDNRAGGLIRPQFAGVKNTGSEFSDDLKAMYGDSFSSNKKIKFGVNKIDVDKEDLNEKNNLFDNIRAKQERIKKGSGEKMKKPNEKGYPKHLEKIAKEANENNIKEESIIINFGNQPLNEGFIDSAKKIMAAAKSKFNKIIRKQSKSRPFETPEEASERISKRTPEYLKLQNERMKIENAVQSEFNRFVMQKMKDFVGGKVDKKDIIDIVSLSTVIFNIMLVDDLAHDYKFQDGDYTHDTKFLIEDILKYMKAGKFGPAKAIIKRKVAEIYPDARSLFWWKKVYSEVRSQLSNAAGSVYQAAEYDEKIKLEDEETIAKRDKILANKKESIKEDVMKINFSKKVLKEDEEKDYEGEMARIQLTNIIEDSQELMGMLKDDSQLPAWIQSKLTIAEHNLDASLDYMKHGTEPKELNEGILNIITSNSKLGNLIKDYVKKHNILSNHRIGSHVNMMDKILGEESKDVLFAFVGTEMVEEINSKNKKVEHKPSKTVIVAFTENQMYVGHKKLIFGASFEGNRRDSLEKFTIHQGILWSKIIFTLKNKEKIIIGKIRNNAVKDIRKFLEEFSNLSAKLEDYKNEEEENKEFDEENEETLEIESRSNPLKLKMAQESFKIINIGFGNDSNSYNLRELLSNEPEFAEFKNLSEQVLNEGKMWDNFKWKIVLFSVKFAKEEVLNEILEGYYSDKKGKPTKESMSVSKMNKSEKISKMREILKSIPDEAKKKILDDSKIQNAAKKMKGKEALIGGAVAGLAAAGAAPLSVAVGAEVSHEIYSNVENKALVRSNDIMDSRISQLEDKWGKDIIDKYFNKVEHRGGTSLVIDKADELINGIHTNRFKLEDMKERGVDPNSPEYKKVEDSMNYFKDLYDDYKKIGSPQEEYRNIISNSTQFSSFIPLIALVLGTVLTFIVAYKGIKGIKNLSLGNVLSKETAKKYLKDKSVNESAVNEALTLPKKGEDKNDFISRFMSSELAKKEFPDNKQRVAVAYSQWERASGDKTLKEEKHPMLVKYGVEGFNKPKRTPSHKTKSHLVVAKKGEDVKVVRFGAQGVKGSPKKEGESESYRKRREGFVARHKAQNPQGMKDKFSPLYWSNKIKW